MGILSLITGKPGASGFGSGSTAEQVTEGIYANALTVIVTGGSSGIGFETSRVFALRGAHVIIAARNTEAASEAKKRIMKINPVARIDVLKLDLSSLKSVRAFADQFNSMNLPLNILINNAGVMFCPFQLSEDEVEMQFATNHLGHFLLTNLLLDNMKTTAKSTDTMIKWPMDNLSLQTYCTQKSSLGGSRGNSTCHLFWKNVPQGAATTCYVGLNPQLKGVTGKYFADCNEERTSAHVKSDAFGEAALGIQRGAHQIRKMRARKKASFWLLSSLWYKWLVSV